MKRPSYARHCCKLLITGQSGPTAATLSLPAEVFAQKVFRAQWVMKENNVSTVEPLSSARKAAHPTGMEVQEPRVATISRAPTASPNFVLAIVCVGIVLANLDLFIVNVALPNIGLDFKDSTLEDLSWILNAYAIVYAALLVFFGRLAERFRRDRSFLLAVALFTAASMACSLANSVGSLVAFRIVQAAGAALMTPTSLGLLLAVFPAEKRSGAVRTWTAIGGFGAALGPLVGGVLVTLNWRWIFLVNVPIGIAALLIGWWKLPRVSGHESPKPHPWDAILVTGGIGSLVFAIVKVNDWGWASTGVDVAVAVAAILLALFVWRCTHSTNPFVDPALFRIRQFAGASLVMVPYSAAFGAMLLSVSLWEQAAWKWSALQTGLAIAPGPLLVPTTSLLLAGRLIKRFGASVVISAGILSFAAGLVWYALAIGPEPSGVCCGHRHDSDGDWRRLDLSHPHGRERWCFALVSVCDRLGRNQHAQAGITRHRRRNFCDRCWLAQFAE